MGWTTDFSIRKGRGVIQLLGVLLESECIESRSEAFDGGVNQGPEARAVRVRVLEAVPESVRVSAALGGIGGSRCFVVFSTNFCVVILVRPPQR